MANAGFRILAFDFRGFGQSHGPGDSDMFTAPMQLDVLAAVRHLRKNGAKTVAVMGGSFGGSFTAKMSNNEGPTRGRLSRSANRSTERSQPGKPTGGHGWSGRNLRFSHPADDPPSSNASISSEVMRNLRIRIAAL